MLNPPPPPSNTANEVSDLAVHGWVGFFEFFSFFIFCECVDRLSHSQQVNLKWRHAKPGNNNGDIASSSRQIHVKKSWVANFCTMLLPGQMLVLCHCLGSSTMWECLVFPKIYELCAQGFLGPFFSIGSSDHHNYRMH